MTDRVLHRYLADRRPSDGDDPNAPAPAPEADGTDNLGCFGWLRGIRDRAIMLDLRKKDGVCRAIPYSWIESIDFDPSEGITIQALGRSITIKGRNLNGEARPSARLYEGLTRHRVPWIQEAEHAATAASTPDRASAVVESIVW